MKKEFQVTAHALKQFEERAKLLGVNGSIGELKRLLPIATPETPNGKTASFELFKRSMLYKKARFLTANGWRFVVVAGNRVVTVERVKPHENFRR